MRRLRSIPVLLLVLLALFAGVVAAQSNTVAVGLVEYEINMPTAIPAGPTTFEVTNNGTIEHNFEVEGQGIEREFESNLQPGESQTMTFDDLPVGSYTVYCPVDNHRQLGMELQLSVAAAGEAAAPEALPEAGAALLAVLPFLLLLTGLLLLITALTRHLR